MRPALKAQVKGIVIILREEFLQRLGTHAPPALGELGAVKEAPREAVRVCMHVDVRRRDIGEGAVDDAVPA